MLNSEYDPPVKVSAMFKKVISVSFVMALFVWSSAAAETVTLRSPLVKGKSQDGSSCRALCSRLQATFAGTKYDPKENVTWCFCTADRSKLKIRR
jgi:hypothetical protein